MLRYLLSVFLAGLFMISPVCGQSDMDDAANPNLRKPRKAAVSGELGANSLASMFGVVVHYYPVPQAALDLGLGLSGVGIRPGLRVRYNFTGNKSTPFIGAALKYGMGTRGADFEIEDPDTKEKLRIKVNSSPFVDVMLGLDYMAHSGFLFIATIGYSMLLGGDNVEVVSGTPSDDAQKVFDMAYGSGLGISISLGKAF